MLADPISVQPDTMLLLTSPGRMTWDRVPDTQTIGGSAELSLGIVGGSGTYSHSESDDTFDSHGLALALRCEELEVLGPKTNAPATLIRTNCHLVLAANQSFCRTTRDGASYDSFEPSILAVNFRTVVRHEDNLGRGKYRMSCPTSNTPLRKDR